MEAKEFKGMGYDHMAYFSYSGALSAILVGVASCYAAKRSHRVNESLHNGDQGLREGHSNFGSIWLNKPENDQRILTNSSGDGDGLVEKFTNSRREKYCQDSTQGFSPRRDVGYL